MIGGWASLDFIRKNMIKKLWQHLTKRRRNQFFLLLILMILASVMEIVSIGAVVPFLAALTSPEQIYQHHLAQPLIQILDITKPSQLLLPLTVIFIMATLIAAAVRLLLLYVSTRLSYATGADLSIDIYKRTLYQDYSIHASRNSSEVINSIIIKTNTVIGGILVPLLTLISSVIIMLGIVAIVFTINAQVALTTFFVFTFFYWIIAFFSKKSLQKNSQLIAVQSTQMVKSLQEGLGGIRDVLIDGTQIFYCKLYQNADSLLRRASGDNLFIGSSPRYLMEAIGMILIAILAYILTLQEGGVVVAIPILGALAVGAQKLLPAFQLAYSSYSAIKGSKSSFIDVLNLLNQPLPYDTSQDLINLMPFKQEIVFKDLSFRYTKDTPWILKNVSLSFKKGETIGFIGVTGSGKSTLLDILMGLLTPTSGELLIDGVAITQENRRAWQMHISHVPQSIYLVDSTIQENIAFGVETGEIKECKIFQAAQQAQIAETINNLKNKYKSFVGEQGVQLSGGQRQRIGIARALYKDNDVLIFDEATSALDNKTEQKIMQQIAQLKGNKTIFMIAHRLTTLKQCDRIIRINTDYTVDQVNYDQIELN
jgi:ATP-binding cassette, subfamily B, bacterial PglK